METPSTIRVSVSASLDGDPLVSISLESTTDAPHRFNELLELALEQSLALLRQAPNHGDEIRLIRYQPAGPDRSEAAAGARPF